MKNRAWTYQAHPQWKNTPPFPVDMDTLRAAQRQLASCEACTPGLAEIPFDYVLDCVTGCDPEVTDYVLTEAARCPRCGGPVQNGYWHWYTAESGGRGVFILPGTLVTLKDRPDDMRRAKSARYS